MYYKCLLIVVSRFSLTGHAADIFWYNSDENEKSEEFENKVLRFNRRPKIEDFVNRKEEVFVVSGPPMFNKCITSIARHLQKKVIVL